MVFLLIYIYIYITNTNKKNSFAQNSARFCYGRAGITVLKYNNGHGKSIPWSFYECDQPLKREVRKVAN